MNSIFTSRRGVVLLTIAALFCSTNLLADTEPNNSLGQANVIPFNELHNGSLGIDPANDNDDYYSITLPEDGTLSISLTTDASLTSRIYLYYQSSSFILSSGNINGTDALEVSCLAAGQYYVRINRITGTGSYSLNTSVEIPTNANDAEPNNSISDDNELLEPGQTTEGHLGFYSSVGAVDAWDFYRLNVNEDGQVNTTFYPKGTLEGRIYLYHSNGAFIQSSAIGGDTVILNIDCFAADTIYVGLSRNSGCGGYEFEFTISQPEEDYDAEPNNNLGEASVTINPGEIMEGHLGYYNAEVGLDSWDYYKLNVNEDGQVNTTFYPQGTLEGRIYLYHSNGTFIQSSPIGGDTVTLNIDCFAADTVYMGLSRNSGCGGYKFDFTISQPVEGYDAEPNNTQAQASVTLDPGEITEGHLGYYNAVVGSDNSDYYLLNVNNDGQVTATANLEDDLSGRIYIYYSNGAQAVVGTIGTGEITATLDCVAADTLYALVYLYSGCGGYDFKFEIEQPSTDYDLEPNNTQQLASVVLEPQQITEGHLGYYRPEGGTDTHDFYHINVNHDGLVTATANLGESLQGRIYLYYSNGTQAVVGDIGSDEVSVSLDCVASDTLYALVWRHVGCGGYDFHFEIEQPAAGYDFEPNNTQELASVVLDPEQVTEGHLGYYSPNGSTDVSDYYRINVNQDGLITATANLGESLQGRIYLYYSNGSQATVGTIGPGEVSASINCIAADTLYALVYRHAGCGGYSFHFEIDPPLYANDEEPNNSIAEAIVTENDDINQGHLGYYKPVGGTDIQDFYQIAVVEAPFELEAKVTLFETLTGRLYLLNSGGSQITFTNIQSGEFSLDYTINEPGTYYVRILLNSGCGSYTLGDFCANQPEVTATAQGPTTFCPGESVTLEANSGLDAYEWVYQGSIVGTDQEFVAEEEGTYVVIGYDINGCASVSNEIQVEFFEIPELTVMAMGEIEFCEGNDVTLEASSGFDSYEWSNAEEGQSIIVDQSGTFSVVATSFEGCVVTSSNSVSTTEFEVPELIIFVDGPSEVCPGNDVEMLASPGFDSYEWSNGDSGQSIIVSDADDYSVDAVTSDGCSTSSNTVTISNFYVPELIVSPAGPEEFCDGGSVELTASAGFSDYDWSNSDSGQTILAEESGTYSVTGTTSDGCMAVSNSVELMELPSDHPDCVDCPDLLANIGDPCDDSNPATENDVVTADCECQGIPVEGCYGDFNYSGNRDTGDLLILIAEFGCTENCMTDLSGDDEVGSADLLNLLAIFGADCD